MSSEHLHDWLDEREPEDKPTLWDERELVDYDPEPPEDREEEEFQLRKECEEAQPRRLKSRYEGAGEAFTLYVPYYTDALADTSEETMDAHEEAFGKHLQKLLAAEHGYTEIVVEMCIPHQVQTMVNATAGRAEHEIEEAIGPDVYAELSNRAFDAAWDEVCEKEGT